MSEQVEAKCTDERVVPPLGYCAECLREGHWVRAATLWEGTALCAQDLLYAVGPAESLRERLEEDGIREDPNVFVQDSLRRGLYSRAAIAGF